NLYTGFGITQVFLLGATKLTGDVVLCYLLFSILFFVGSLISDLRDYRGDKAVGIKTMPVYVGYNATKKFIYFLLIMFSISILGLNLPELFILLPFALLMFFFLGMNKPDIAHFCGGISFVLLAIRLVIA
ncbi:MAG: UbiA family prenyltransferase, partial [Candidatus Altiarchaeales archaeon]|nr:UbiA family prenyltransferase [Candidatus Altiarchaeales archaeon]